METEAQAWSSEAALRGQFETETSEDANTDFGAWVMQPAGDDLLIGLGNFPADTNGSLVSRTEDGSTFTTERVLDEQGVHDMQLVGDRLFVAGTDPTDDWTLGNLYERSAAGVWTKRRTLPNVLHSFGLWHDETNLFVATGAHAGDNATWKGRVLRSTDDGATWSAQVDVNNYRILDVIGHAGKLYAAGLDASLTEGFYSSEDNGATWGAEVGVTPVKRPRMIAFGTSLLVAGRTTLYQIDASHAVTTHNLLFVVPDLYNVMATDGESVYVIDSEGYVWRSADLATWERYTFVANALALCWSPGTGLMIADKGLSARVWVA